MNQELLKSWAKAQSEKTDREIMSLFEQCDKTRAVAKCDFTQSAKQAHETKAERAPGSSPGADSESTDNYMTQGREMATLTTEKP